MTTPLGTRRVRNAVQETGRGAPTPPAMTHTTPPLTRREREVIEAWMHARSKAEVAWRLGIATPTVARHIANVRAKYQSVGVHAPTKAALLAAMVAGGLLEAKQCWHEAA